MSDDPVLATLTALPHFRLLAREVVQRLAEDTRIRRLETGSILFREGEPCKAFYAVRAGAVKLYRATGDGREQVVHHFGSGQTFAEAALLSLGRYPANAVATETPTELVEIGGEAFLHLFAEDKRLAAAMVGSLCMRLVSLVERVEELSLVNAGSRLSRFLLRLPGSGTAGRQRIDLPMAKKELAAHLSMTPETLSRLLRRWQDLGLVDSERGSLTVLDAERFLALADGEELRPRT